MFYPSGASGSEEQNLHHAAITVTNASSEPGVGQKQVERVLQQANELILADDASRRRRTTWPTRRPCGARA